MHTFSAFSLNCSGGHNICKNELGKGSIAKCKSPPAPDQSHYGVGTVRKREMRLGRDGLFPSVLCVCVALVNGMARECWFHVRGVFPTGYAEVYSARMAEGEFSWCTAAVWPGKGRSCVGGVGVAPSVQNPGERENAPVADLLVDRAYVLGLPICCDKVGKVMHVRDDRTYHAAPSTRIQAARSPPALFS